MNYYEVLPASLRYHGSEPLTYNSPKLLKPGQIVSVELAGRIVLGLVTKQTSRPEFKLKQIDKIYSDILLPRLSLSLLSWLADYYPAGFGVIVSQFMPKSLLLPKRNSGQQQSKITALQKLPHLTDPQVKALQQIKQTGQGGMLLHGATGSGKTRIYQELAKEALTNGQSVLILAPEIALTAQLISSFEKTFKNQLIVLHSALTPSKRRQAWLDILEAKQPVIVIGPRSALFSPFKKLGLVVVDEAHETAYKQEQAPYYYGLRVASKLAQLHNARLIFGTATPNISEYYLAEAKQLPIVKLSSQALPAVQPMRTLIVDAKDRANFSRDPNLSDKLLTELEDTLKRSEQALVFLNRRGTARIIRCTNGDWQALCPNCDLPLTYHGDSHSMRCHTCGFKQSTPASCPVCGSPDIIFRSIGTKSIAGRLSNLFPRAKIARFDADNTAEERFEQHYQQVASGEFDIIVGTQILAKGLDLPKLSLVGVVAAESSLYFPDYTAEERTYQLLSQVLGRVGRGHRPAVAVIQSYDPKGVIVSAATSHDWSSFYQQQLEERRLFGWPPFYHLLKLTVRRKTKAGSQSASQKLRDSLIALDLKIKIIGPSPAWHEKVGGNYQWQLVIKAKARAELLKVIEHLPAGWTHNIDPINLL